jgi:hypothetical protein
MTITAEDMDMLERISTWHDTRQRFPGNPLLDTDPLDTARELHRRMIVIRDVGGRDVPQLWIRQLEWWIANEERAQANDKRQGDE